MTERKRFEITVCLAESWEALESKPFKDLPKVAFFVDQDTSLREIIDKASRDFGIEQEFGWSWIGFRDEDSERASEVRAYLMLDIISRDGRLNWNIGSFDWDKITFKELQATYETGFLKGNPRTLFLIQEHPVGNGLVIDWPQFIAALKATYDFVKELGAAGAGVVLLYQLIDVVLKYWEDWQARGGGPHEIVEAILLKPHWNCVELARLFGMEEEDAKNWLRALGYRYNSRSQLFERVDHGTDIAARKAVRTILYPDL